MVKRASVYHGVIPTKRFTLQTENKENTKYTGQIKSNMDDLLVVPRPKARTDITNVMETHESVEDEADNVNK